MIRKIKMGKEFEVKKNTETMDKNIFIYKNQIPMINQLYLNQNFEGKKEITKSIKQKISSYKSQDTKKDKLDDNFINYTDFIGKIGSI